MRQLSKLESFIYLFGGLLMVAGAGLYAFFIAQPVACWLMLAGAVGFVLMQLRQSYLGTGLTIRRLRKIMMLADAGFILAGLFMVEDSYHFLQPVVANSLDGYSSYISIFHHNWVVILLIAAILEIYTTHRISYELEKEDRAASN
ncbi:MAG: hypothetical protein K6A82_00745 [Prevotella sp.]|nr:hypothetical protein [Prevotella sp.]